MRLFESWNDERLSFEALGVLAYLAGQPAGARLTVPMVMERGGVGRCKALALVRHLVTFGYLRRHIERERGRVRQGWYELRPEVQL